MNQVTLEKIEEKQTEIVSKQSELEDLIKKLKLEVKTAFIFPSTEIKLAHGEHYAGLIVGKDGEPSHHLILCAGEKEKSTWQEALDWAKNIGFELPTRREQALLYANLKDQFQEAWYWSSETRASHSDCAWLQDFYCGGQGYDTKLSHYRARAVRRLVIE